MDEVRSGPVVQRIECQIPVLKVVGSNPAGVTKKAAQAAFFIVDSEFGLVNF